MNSDKKILILYTSAGMGHKVLAENFAYWLEKAGFVVRAEDMLAQETGKSVQAYVKLQAYVNQYLPFIWRFMYLYGYVVTMPFRTRLIAKNSPKLQSIIEEFQPDLVISTQTSSSAIVSYLKQKGIYKGKFAIAFSDFHFHPYWVYPHCDHYFINIEEQKPELLKRGLSESQVTVAGLTLKPKQDIHIASVRDKLGLKEGTKLVLVSSGGQGFGLSDAFLDDMVASLLAQADQQQIDLKIAIVCGKNQMLYDRLSKQVLDPRVMVFGYYTPLAELYAVADIYITKPGGLSTAESLEWNLPMLITHWLPGQEELNYEYLRENHLIMPGPQNPYDWQPEAIARSVISELQSANSRTSLQNHPVRTSLTQGTSENSFLKLILEMFH